MTLSFLPNFWKRRSPVASGAFHGFILSMLVAASGLSLLHAQTEPYATGPNPSLPAIEPGGEGPYGRGSAANVVPVAGTGVMACLQNPPDNDNRSPIIGSWFVHAPQAPFQYHMFSFHSDRTMQQASPDAGDPATSDSNGMGVWVSDGDTVKGKFVEVTADRVTHQFVRRGEISFVIKVKGDAFSGTASTVFFNLKGQQIKGPLATSLEGQRLVLP